MRIALPPAVASPQQFYAQPAADGLGGTMQDQQSRIWQSFMERIGRPAAVPAQAASPLLAQLSGARPMSQQQPQQQSPVLNQLRSFAPAAAAQGFGRFGAAPSPFAGSQPWWSQQRRPGAGY